MKSAYVKPLINRLQQGRMNIYGTQPSYVTKVKSHIDGVAIDELVSRYGSPLYVYSENTLRNKVREVHQEFSSRYPNVTLAWSYKTNYLQAICAVMHQEGSLAEVVSEMEYSMARNLGIPGERIIFNGPYKPRHVLELAVAEGAMINIDHMDELHDLEQIAQKRGKAIDVGMRLSLDAGIQPQWSRFGLSLETGQAREAVQRMA
ncbi:MAG: diaminopimelate decarboxylase, partial [Desulfobacterales bacterium]|nr:diaminopimelate decarboxylase [Desulfobacterales bacterium]